MIDSISTQIHDKIWEYFCTLLRLQDDRQFEKRFFEGGDEPQIQKEVHDMIHFADQRRNLAMKVENGRSSISTLRS